ncbi:MAG: HutD family protein [Sedimentibacter sp.]|uniref:HutD family protein n=1 Tax=Sedimentibacter sp. TaxID=1960295 RepID=UPI002980B986|nr:HutD family protein [Sedimentibacter sp.]MDW5299705.1 HutD family protein [Sedimentibacter sp.]
MNITVIKEDAVTTSRWAGGESKQYFIYPLDSDYVSRNFMFRLSMATSNSDGEAKYSNLENFTRYLIMLEGKSRVFHKNRYNIDMEPYKEIDVFDGGWESSAIGKVTDFNMMLSKNCEGMMSVVDKSGIITINDLCETCNKKYNWLAFFCGLGYASFKISDNEIFNISKGDLILFEEISSELKINVSLENSKLIRMDICCCK